MTGALHVVSEWPVLTAQNCLISRRPVLHRGPARQRPLAAGQSVRHKRVPSIRRLVARAGRLRMCGIPRGTSELGRHDRASYDMDMAMRWTWEYPCVLHLEPNALAANGMSAFESGGR